MITILVSRFENKVFYTTHIKCLFDIDGEWVVSATESICNIFKKYCVDFRKL